EKMGRAGGELDDFDATLHRAHRVEKYFPVLLADDQRELLLRLRHGLAEPRQDPRPAKGRGRPPSWISGDRRFHGKVDVLPVGERDNAHDLTGRGVGDIAPPRRARCRARAIYPERDGRRGRDGRHRAFFNTPCHGDLSPASGFSRARRHGSAYLARHLLKPCSREIKQVFAGVALEAVFAAAQRPPGNEDSQDRPLVVTRRFQAKLRYWSGGQCPAATGPSVTEDSCRPETGTRAARSGSARIPRQKEWAYDPSLAPDRCADPRGIVHRLRSGDRRPCRRGHFEAGDILHRRRADFSSEVSGVSSAELHRADVAHHLPGRTALGAIDQGARRDAADAAVAYRPQRRRAEIQERNDMSLSDDQVDTIVRWVDGGALQGDPKDLPPPRPLVTDNEWKAVRDGYGPPDLIVRSSEYTMPAEHQDVWYRPMSEIPLTEPRWVKM